MKPHFYKILFFLFFSLLSCVAQKNVEIPVGNGWSSNSVNTVKFRKNALTTFKDFQFIAYYDNDGAVILGKRKLNSTNWEIVKTSYSGNVKDAHNTISIAIDGDGYLHISWDHHDTKLRYAKSKYPLSLDLGKEESMTGIAEQKVTYPEFHNLPNGNLVFFYRSGASGRGNMILNLYSVKEKKWSQLQSNLLNGEEQRSAYWQAKVDKKGTIHLSWVWRESWDVSTNHDICYARSFDGGLTWEKSNGEKYNLPITVASAEIAWKIPEKSSLINQTSMIVDKNENPYIANYWSENTIPQFQIVYLENGIWKKSNTGFRKTSFYLGGGGTKKIPISRPDLLIKEEGKKRNLYLLFRDAERENKVSMAYTNLSQNAPWKVTDLTSASIGEWEPNYDISLWEKQKKLHIFLQNVNQVDGEGLAKSEPTMVRVLEVNQLPK
ncbi:BNR repeat-containing family member [Flavobacterium resistens]|uniref:BNR repeat-containing family member n=1 Tax=Flavobacterium resistens TaxID=443612 RepID=A0A521DX04_9FLAO|nr:BNR repeat-containing protein [Flavobacterium resistens]MRX68141.1 neuraminidase [Flavobacterium resistens]SMO75400.1 BNR repeat-containing family member [Flavobacterium resistens]